MGSCLVPDTTYYYSPSEAGRQYRGDMDRTNLFIFINHEMNNGMEMFAEIGRYESNSLKKDNNGSFTAGIIADTCVTITGSLNYLNLPWISSNY